MISFLYDNPIFVWALLVSITAGIIGGSVGPLVVVRRMSFLSGSIAHAVLAGVGLFIWLERAHHMPMPSPIFGALFAAFIAAWCLSILQKSERLDSAIAALWASGMAIGIILLSQTPGYTTEVNNILIGNILFVGPQDLLILAVLALFTIAFITIRFQHLKLVLFDPTQAKLQGIDTEKMYTHLLFLVAISVVALVQVVGIVLVMTFLTLPALLAGLFCRHLSTMIFASIGVAMVCSIAGLLLAYWLDWPAGASITICATCFYGMGKIGKSGIRTHGTLTGTRP